MNDEQLLRYSRHVLLPEIDVAGQERLLGARVLVVGVGGLGSPVAMYLAASGVGTLILADGDTVDLSNLQRQIVHSTPDIGRPKVESARARLAALNPEVSVRTLDRALDARSLPEAIAGADLVVDATDNFRSRFAVNAACVRAGRPLVSGAAIRFEGQVTTVLPGSDAPCYRCLYDEATPDAAETCSETGVAAPLLGIIGSVQALEALKVLTGAGRPLAGRLLCLDGLTMQWRCLRYRRDPHCPVCGESAARG